MSPIESLLIATKNKGKVSEFRELIDGSALSLRDLSHEPGAPDVVEDGASFIENACKKASEYAVHFGTWALADDSGLAVDALEGDPGIHSARWAEMHEAGKGDADNNKLLLEQLEDVPDENRTARFMCALALADEKGRIVLTCQDSVEGRLLRKARGTNGFGYDPLFFVDGHGKTTAELSSDEKHEISHRGKAMRTMVKLMKEHGLLA
jgi:XTP/dITP diphosphohydrolase